MSLSSCSVLRTRMAAVTRFLWVSMQPFGGPVVPDV